MTTTRLLATLTCLIGMVASTPAFAVDYLSVNLGDYNALRSGQDHVLQYGAEYRFSELQYGIRPIIGGFGTAEGGAYGYAGLNWDVPLLPNQLYLVPNFAAGAYRDGSGKKLGGTLEFRSGIELDYQFANAHQVGIALNHISNAGIYDHNSGEESVIATYSIPVGTIFGGR
jgi:lipid A 3-O-deacylase